MSQMSDSSWCCGKRALAFTCGTALFCDYALFGVISPMLPVLFIGRVSAAELERLFMSKAAVQLLCGPLAGYAVDRMGPRLLLPLGLVALAVASFMCGHSIYSASSSTYGLYWTLLIWRAVSGVASAIIGPSSMALVALMRTSSSTEEENQKALGTVRNGMILGMICGPCLAWLMQVSMGLPFYVIGIITVVVLVLHGALAWANPQDSSLDGANTQEEARHGAAQLVRDPLLYCILAPLLSCVTIEAAITVSQPLHLATGPLYCGLDFILYMFCLFGAMAIATSFVYGPCLGHRLSSQTHIAVGNAMMVAGLFLIFSFPDKLLVLAGNCLAGFSISPTRIGTFVLQAVLVDYRGLKVYGFAMSCNDMVACLGYILGPLIASVVGDQFQLLPIVYGIALLITAVLPYYAYQVEIYRQQKYLSDEERPFAKESVSDSGTRTNYSA